MTVEHEWHGHVLVAKLLGEIAFFDSDGLGDSLHAILPTRPTLVVLDLSGVAYLGSIGTSLLVRLAQDLRNRGASLILAGANPTIRRVLHTVRLHALMTLTDSPETFLHRLPPSLLAPPHPPLPSPLPSPLCAPSQNPSQEAPKHLPDAQVLCL